jgi:hypothetical protein
MQVFVEPWLMMMGAIFALQRQTVSAVEHIVVVVVSIPSNLWHLRLISVHEGTRFPNTPGKYCMTDRFGVTKWSVPFKRDVKVAVVKQGEM